MGWSLDRGFFTSLVGFYLLSICLTFAAQAYEAVGPGWGEFAADFDLLIDRHFGAASQTGSTIALILVAIGLVWHVAAALGLRRFQRWSRPSFWMSEILLIIAIFVPSLAAPIYLGPLGNVTEGARLGLFAIILLLCYSQEHGIEWFKPRLQTLKETF